MIGWMEEYKTRLFAFKTATKISDYVESYTDAELMDDAGEANNYYEAYDKRFYVRLSLKLRENRGSILRVNHNCLLYIDELWTTISRYFLLPPLPILLEKIRDGCIEITWIVPVTIALTINLKATSQGSVEFYQQKNIMRIVMDDKVVYNEDKEEDKAVYEEDKESDIPRAIVEVHCLALINGKGLSNRYMTFY